MSMSSFLFFYPFSTLNSHSLDFVFKGEFIQLEFEYPEGILSLIGSPNNTLHAAPLSTALNQISQHSPKKSTYICPSYYDYDCCYRDEQLYLYTDSTQLKLM